MVSDRFRTVSDGKTEQKIEKKMGKNAEVNTGSQKLAQIIVSSGNLQISIIVS